MTYFWKCILSIIVAINVFGQVNFDSIKWKRTNSGGGGAFNVIGASASGTIFVGSDLSGVYRSIDGGISWEVPGVNEGFTETHVSALGFHPSNGAIVFVGTENGLFKSDDGGFSFYKVLNWGYITDIQLCLSAPDTGYLVLHSAYNIADATVYKTVDGGNTWFPTAGSLPANIHGLKLVVHPDNPDIAYLLTGMGRFACGDANVFRTTDGGTSWTNITTGLPPIMDIAIMQQHPDTLYLTTMEAHCDSPYYWYNLNGSLYRSDDGGSTWQALANKTGVIVLDPANPSFVRLIDPREPFLWNPDAGTFSSYDGGSSFVKTGDVAQWDVFFNGDPYWCYGTSFNGIVKTIGFDMSNPQNVFWVTSQWAYKSSDTGNNLTNIFTNQVSSGRWRSRGLDNITMMDVEINKANPNRIHLGYFDIGIWSSEDRGYSWYFGNDTFYTGSWEGHGGNVISIASDPQRENIIWITQSENQNGQYPTYLIKNNNYADPLSWENASNGLPLIEIMGISLDLNSPVNNRTLFVTAQGDVYKSTDDGLSWNKVFDCNGCRFTAVDPLNSNIVYAGGEAGLWRSLNGGSSWSNISHPDMNTINQSFWDWNYSGIWNVKTFSEYPTGVFVVVKGPNKGLYLSTDTGNTWIRLLTDDFLRDVTVVPGHPEFLIATSSSAFQAGGYEPNSNGILMSIDSGSTWQTVNNDMAFPFAAVVDAAVINDSAFIIVGIQGTGFQTTMIPLNAIPPDTTSNSSDTTNMSDSTNTYHGIVQKNEITLVNHGKILYLKTNYMPETISLMDISGKAIPVERRIKHAGSTIIIDLQGIPDGMYILKAGSNSFLIHAHFE